MPRLDPLILTTGECQWRPWTLKDACALREACADPDICRFTTVPLVYSKADAVHWIERQQAHAARGTAIVLAGEEEPVGMIGLFGLDQPEQVARFGYWLIADARGRRLTTEAARAFAGWAFDRLEVERVIIDCQPTNRASARVAAHLGATFVGSRWAPVGDDEVELNRYRLTRMPA